MSELELRRKFLQLLKEDEEFRYAVTGLIGLDEVLKRLDKHGEELVKLREDFNKAFEELRKIDNQLREDFNKAFEELRRTNSQLRSEVLSLRNLTIALGARWGILAESAFREAMKGVISERLGLKVERWSCYDSDGYVHGHPALVEVDIAITDKEHVLMEIKSSVSRYDVSGLFKASKLYEREKGVRPRLLIVSPFVDESAKKEAEVLGIGVYTAT